MILRQNGGRPLVIGHRGAARVAPENSLEGLEAAVAAGADLVEFDVGSGLILGHPGDPVPARPPTLDEALGLLAAHEIGIHIDLKLTGAEGEIGAAARRSGVADRVVVSSTSAKSLRALAREAPELARAISYPQDRHGVGAIPWPGSITRPSVAALRSVMPGRAGLLLAASGADALSLHHALISGPLVRTAHRRGAAVIAWTINDPDRVEKLTRLGVDAVVTDDPQMARQVLATLNWT